MRFAASTRAALGSPDCLIDGQWLPAVAAAAYTVVTPLALEFFLALRLFNRRPFTILLMVLAVIELANIDADRRRPVLHFDFRLLRIGP